MQAGIFGSLRSWIWLAGSFVMLVAVLTIFVLLGHLPAGTLILIIGTFGTLVLADFVARLIGDDRQAGFLMLFLLILGLILLFVFPVEGRRAAEASIMLLDGALALFILGVAYISLQGVTYGLALVSVFLLLGTVKVASGRG